jgi:hypothetical protein
MANRIAAARHWPAASPARNVVSRPKRSNSRMTPDGASAMRVTSVAM